MNYHREWIEANLASLDKRISAWDTEPKWCPQFNGLYETCVDTNVTPDGSILVDKDGDDCAAYAHNPGFCGRYDAPDFVAGDLCCGCGGGGVRIEETADNGNNEFVDEGEEENGNDGEEENGDDGEEENDDVISVNCQC